MRSATRLLLVVLLIAPCGAGRAVVLEVDSEPSRLDAWANGRYLGRTPLRTTIETGEVNIRLAEPSRSLYHAPVVDTVLNFGDADTMRAFFRVGSLVSVRSLPFGLPILRNGRKIGSTPLSFRLDPEEGERLELLTPGGLVLIDAQELHTRQSWLWRGEESSLQIPVRAEPTRLHKIGRYLMPAVALTMAAGGLIAEEQADRSYRAYLRAADPDEIEARYDETRRRDRWAAAFWVAAEITAASAVIAWILPDEERPSLTERNR